MSIQMAARSSTPSAPTRGPAVRKRGLFFTGVLVVLVAIGLASAANDPVPVQTLCILDFHRLGDDARADWLEQGLADMMIRTMDSLSPYLVIERKHLREILREHGLAGSGIVDVTTAVRQAQLVKAELLLLGSFALEGDQLTIQVRLVRVSDERVLTQITWKDHASRVLAAPRALSEKLLASVGSPFDSGKLEGIEKHIPVTIDVAKSYYRGVSAFDEGRYPEALAHYLDAARGAVDFRTAHAAVLEMYYLLGRSEHAVLFARELARSYEEKGEAPAAVEYYFTAARECLDPLNNPGLAIELLGRLLRLVEEHERITGEIARTKRSILDRITALQGTGNSFQPEKILADRDIRHRMWTGDIERELARRQEEQARGGYSVFEDGNWIKQPVPAPSMLMWRIRARQSLARAYARSGNIEPALDRYRELLEEHEFLPRLYDRSVLDPIKTEAHFMLLRHYAETGRLVRNHAMNRINRLNFVRDGLVFTRDSRTPAPDARARVSSRNPHLTHEYFDFAAPQGYQIDSVTLRTRIQAAAEFSFDRPQPAGWPPQFSFSKRIGQFRFPTQGVYERKVNPPRGTEFLSLGSIWAPGPNVNRWEISFEVSRKGAVAAARADAHTDPAIRKLIDRYAAGWERASVVRDAQTAIYSGDPRLDVYAEDWLVYSMDGDIRIFHQRDPRTEISLPVTVNTREQEFDPSLVRTHDGRYALLWARGSSRRNAARFVAFSADLLRWETPQRMAFEEPPANTGYTYAQAEPLERSYNVVPAGRGYVMLLAQGFVRHSADLRKWGPPRKEIPQDLLRNRLVKGRDGTIWAVYENSSNELQPYTQEDWLHGYFVVDGKSYRHVTELRVSRSADGIRWEAASKVVLPGQPSGVWAFLLDERQIGIAVGFNNLNVKWFTASPVGDLTQIDSQIQFTHQSEAADFFVQGASLTCIRPVFDFERQKPMLLATSTDRLLGGAGKR